MTLPNPKFAPRRNDLAWLRRRRRPTPVAPAAPPTAKAVPPKAAPPKAAPPKAAPPKAAPPKAAPAKSASAKSAPPTSAPPKAPPPRPAGGRIDYTHHDRDHPTPSAAPTPAPTPTPAPRPPTPAPPRPAPAPVASSGNSLDLSAPSPPPAAPPPTRPQPPTTAGKSVDLSAPPTPSPPPAPTAASTLLDLGGGAPTPPPAAPPAASTSLDLGGGPGGGPGGGSDSPAERRRPTPTPAAANRHHVVRRTHAGATTLLDFGAPVVTLGRVQSGVGALTLDAVVGDEVGDLRIGAAWALTDGRTGTVELDADRRHGPDTRRPVVWAQKEGRFERIALDLRQARSLARLLVYGFSPSKQSLTWGGTVVVTTFGGDRIDAPIVSAPSPAVLALVSLYHVDGEFVLRSEMDPVAGSVRETCRAFGYDRITWLDERTPVA